MSEHEKVERDRFLKGFLQDWVLDAIVEAMPKDEEVKVVSHNLTLRTDKHPMGYSVEIMGIDTFGDVRVEISKNDPNVEPEDKEYFVKRKLQ